MLGSGLGLGSLPLGGMDDGWTLDLWDESPQSERVHARTDRVQFVPYNEWPKERS